MTTRLAFIIPRYGEEILGGAEAITRKFAEHLPRPEFEVEVLTTCMQELGSGHNVYPAGVAQINQVCVRRFPTDPRVRNEHRFHELNARVGQGAMLSVDEQYEWIDANVHSPALYAYIMQQGHNYDFLIFGPYLFGITQYGTTLWPERTVLWPHLHDEPFAHFLQTRLMMESCRGIMFNCEPEMALARRKLKIQNPRTYVVGEGIDDYQADPARFRQRLGLSEPFILYAGRLEFAKNVEELLRFFIEYKRLRPGPLKLVLMGEGPVPVPAHPDILPIGFQSQQDKLDAYAAATLLVQPSLMESFSIVIMESWIAGVPVLVHGHCDVTRYHVHRSNGGLYYTNLAEFIAVLDWMLEHPAERRQMGQLGRAYVLREYNWETVIDRFRAALTVWRGD